MIFTQLLTIWVFGPQAHLEGLDSTRAVISLSSGPDRQGCDSNFGSYKGLLEMLLPFRKK